MRTRTNEERMNDRLIERLIEQAYSLSLLKPARSYPRDDTKIGETFFL